MFKYVNVMIVADVMQREAVLQYWGWGGGILILRRADGYLNIPYFSFKWGGH